MLPRPMVLSRESPVVQGCCTSLAEHILQVVSELVGRPKFQHANNEMLDVQ